MQFLEHYFQQVTANTVTITGQQGNDFAKQVADDFNPIHDVGSKRFCVPGDLLFAIALHKYGLHQSMSFRFLDMVNADSTLMYPDWPQAEPSSLGDTDETIVSYFDAAKFDDDKNDGLGKDVLAIRGSGDVLREPNSVEAVLRKYVAFSGHNFPHILLPLMEEHGVMINPARPLVIYESMSFDLQTLNFVDLDIRLEETSLDVQGKRGNASLNFSFNDSSGEVGRGSKKLVLSGLRPYDAATMQKLCDDYFAVAGATKASA